MDQPPIGNFKSSEWPLHMTLLTPFELDQPFDAFTNSLNQIAENTAAFTVRTSDDALLGPDQDVPVSLIETNSHLRKLYASLMAVAINENLEFEDPLISGENNKFHITTQNGTKAPDNVDISINDFSLIDRRVNGEIGLKQVIQSFTLSKN
jgi:2'-5' RNA ligase